MTMQTLRICRSPSKQRGAALIVAMLFLLVLSLFAITSSNSSTTNLLVTGNMIARQESTAAAQWLIDTTISSSAFATDPKAIAASTYDLDLDQDGTVDYRPTLTPAPTCQRARPLKGVELDIDDASDVQCMKSGSAGGPLIDTGAIDPTAGDSMCANTEWNVRAIVIDEAVSGASVAINQGVGIRVLTTDAEDYCS
jgi:hypothetical protein